MSDDSPKRPRSPTAKDVTHAVDAGTSMQQLHEQLQSLMIFLQETVKKQDDQIDQLRSQFNEQSSPRSSAQQTPLTQGGQRPQNTPQVRKYGFQTVKPRSYSDVASGSADDMTDEAT
eukprot:CAMPEP_0204837828 /NCGR_PEP_ID=MMETSP1346-20131115/29156_1 /ASSEMBLY_ACC=CAM_ASM_000771 /TAXON_ID=215587 /ORGANISM="Aplanochytrium stocchinoi, Strain GSBS06" /LENGTH=116 /DNA_ID=CAMNT_0051973525 /DNA_START=338 /DNA_END=688 /DNA_ORIENTATION=-